MQRRWWALLLVAPAVGAQNAAPDRGVNFYSLEKERALGGQVAAEFRRSVTVIDSPAVNAYLNDLGQRIAAKSQGPAFTYTFELVDGAPSLLNEPIALPGGPVFVPVALILAAKNEDELAGMMAHSIAHIAARHGTKLATKGEIVNQASIPLIMMGGWQGQTVPLGYVKFQRANELQADRLAVQSMAATGYNPSSLADYVERMQPADARVAAIRSAIQVLSVTAHPPHDGFAAIQEEVARWKPAIPAKAPPRLAR
jgi:beta-barrel assembly-enhancing protease